MMSHVIQTSPTLQMNRDQELNLPIPVCYDHRFITKDGEAIITTFYMPRAILDFPKKVGEITSQRLRKQVLDPAGKGGIGGAPLSLI